MVLDTALGSGVNDPLIDVGEAWTIDGATGVANGVAATAIPGKTAIMPIANAMAVENRRTGARRQRLTATSLSRMCPHVLSRYVQIGLHVDLINCKTALGERHGCSTSRDASDRSKKPRGTERTTSPQPRDEITRLLRRDDDHETRGGLRTGSIVAGPDHDAVPESHSVVNSRNLFVTSKSSVSD